MMTGDMELGQVFVQTTSNRGYTPEEIAERAATRILRIQTKEVRADECAAFPA
jgi:hypothetical protein